MKSYAKGARVEREMVKKFQDAGIEAERVPLSGAAGGSYKGDLVIKGQYRAEVKARKGGAGFAMIDRWLSDMDVLIVKRDRQEPMVVMPFDAYAELIAGKAP